MTSELAWAGAAEQARLVNTGEATPAEIIEATLRQIELIDPSLNAFRIVFADQARRDAQRLRPGPLAGVPVAIKDDTDVAGHQTCNGTSATGAVAAADATIVSLLRDAGAIVIGKTQTPELDAWGFTESMTFGATRNPWSLDHTPGGSSGGSGAAAAAGMCGVGHGTDGAGSVRNPASWCGLVGLKPGAGRIPGPAALRGWHGLVVNGALGRHAADVAAFFEAATGEPTVSRIGEPPQRLRIGLTFTQPRGIGGTLDNDRRAAVLEAADTFRALGHDVIPRDPSLPTLTTLALDVRYFGGVAADIDTLPHPERLETRTRSLARYGRAMSPLLPVATRVSRAAAAALDSVLTECPVLLFPGSVQPPHRIGALDGVGAWRTAQRDTARVAFQPLWNLVGYPAVMVPWGFDRNGLPTSVQLGARPGTEALLLRIAAELEQVRRWPDHRPTPICEKSTPTSTSASA